MKSFLACPNLITYQGFRNCVEYAEKVFDAKLKVPIDCSENNFKFNAIPGFIKKLEEFDSSALLKKPNGFQLVSEFVLFKKRILSGNAPNIQLIIPEIRLVILALIYYRDTGDADTMACRNVLDKYDRSNSLFFEESSFFKVEVGGISIPFSIVRFVLLTTLDGISSYNQASIIQYTGGLNSVIPEASFFKVYSVVIQVRGDFFEGRESKFYLISKYLIKSYKKSNVDFYQYSTISDYNDKKITFRSYSSLNFQGFSEFKITVRVPTTITGFDTLSLMSSKRLKVLQAYTDFLVLKLSREIISNVVATNNTFFCYPGVSINSFVVNANNVNLLEKCFKLSFFTIRERHYELFKQFYIKNKLVSNSEYEGWVNQSLCRSRYTISFYRNDWL